MLKRMSVVFCALGLVLVTSHMTAAQTSGTHKAAAAVSDADITTAVKTKLLADKTVGGLKIDVDTNKGVVTLTGPVDTPVERSHAVNIARHTHGVKHVVDKLTIEKKSASNGVVDKSVDAVKGTSGTVAKDSESAAQKTGTFLSDAEITTAVKTKLATDSGVHAMDVHVDTDKGVVTLTGSVRSDAEKVNALHIARKTKGVKRVVDKLTVK